MRYVPVGRALVVGFALLVFLTACSVPFCAEQVPALKITALKGTVKVTKPDGTTETLADTSKPIELPATIEMEGEKGSFWLSLPATLENKYNTVSWTLRQGEAVRVSLLKNNKGVRFEYLKGTRNIFVLVNNRENVIRVNSVTGQTSLVVSQNRFTVPEKSSALVTTPLNVFSSVTVRPGQVSELEFSYSAFEQPIEIVPPGIPVTEPERIEQSPYRP
jgi:hypothetical protein